MTPDQIIPVIAPELGCDDTDDAIAIADMQIAPGLCGDKRPVLVAYLAAHIMTLGKRGGAGGPVTSLKEGQLSIGYGATGIMGSLGQTAYGAEYDRISRACVFAARTRVRCV